MMISSTKNSSPLPQKPTLQSSAAIVLTTTSPAMIVMLGLVRFFCFLKDIASLTPEQFCYMITIKIGQGEEENYAMVS
jgi:hypothetical protein